MGRVLLLPFFIFFIVFYHEGKEYLRYFALALVSLSFLSDALDGYFARKWRQKTKLGAFLDPLGDKLLIDSSFLFLIFKPQFSVVLSLPVWVVSIIIIRDILFALGAILLHLKGKLKIEPSMMGKISTFFQMIAILFALLFVPFTKYIWVLCGILTIISAIGYIIRDYPSIVSKQRYVK
jgi:CDP-diacylglycerol--glycerol-3-phosphate 3-phosphatidyltransferase